jgi:hypothetical protein
MDAFSPDMVEWARQQSAHALSNREAEWTAGQAELKANQVAKATPKLWEEIMAREASNSAAAPSTIAKISGAADSFMAFAASSPATGKFKKVTEANPLKKVNFNMLTPSTATDAA